MNPNEKNFWFPAKRYGWGWGPPNCWQGWVVMLAWVAFLAIGGFVLLPDKHPVLFTIFTVAMCAVLCLICYLKGERPGWRWGDK